MIVLIRDLHLIDYALCLEKMRNFTHQRDINTPDEIWIVEHPPVFTQGQNGKAEHLLAPGTIPVVQSDRGGQITYHGPGQLVVYPLIDIERKKINIRELVCLLEKSVIAFLKSEGIPAKSKREAPGVYVEDKKICSIGLRIRKGRAYHGLAFNIDMDLEPFTRINPCGFSNLPITQLKNLGIHYSTNEVGCKLIPFLTSLLGYENIDFMRQNAIVTGLQTS